MNPSFGLRLPDMKRSLVIHQLSAVYWTYRPSQTRRTRAKWCLDEVVNFTRTPSGTKTRPTKMESILKFTKFTIFSTEIPDLSRESIDIFSDRKSFTAREPIPIRLITVDTHKSPWRSSPLASCPWTSPACTRRTPRRGGGELDSGSSTGSNHENIQ